MHKHIGAHIHMNTYISIHKPNLLQPPPPYSGHKVQQPHPYEFHKASLSPQRTCFYTHPSRRNQNLQRTQISLFRPQCSCLHHSKVPWHSSPQPVWVVANSFPVLSSCITPHHQTTSTLIQILVLHSTERRCGTPTRQRPKLTNFLILTLLEMGAFIMTSKPQPFPKMEIFKRWWLGWGWGGGGLECQMSWWWVVGNSVLAYTDSQPWLQAFRPVFPTAGDCAPSKRQLAMSGDVSGCHNLGWEMFLTSYVSHLGKNDSSLGLAYFTLGGGRSWEDLIV